MKLTTNIEYLLPAIFYVDFREIAIAYPPLQVSSSGFGILTVGPSPDDVACNGKRNIGNFKKARSQ